MDCGWKPGSIAKAASVPCIAALILAAFGVCSSGLFGQTQTLSGGQKQIVKQTESASTGSQETLPTQLPVVRFGSDQNEQTQVVGKSGSTPQLVSPPQGVLEQEGVQEGQAKLAVPRQESKFDADAAFGYLTDICKIGPRPSASRGMEKQQKYLQEHFGRIGGKYRTQKFQVVSPYNQQLVDLYNLHVEWHPERVKRLLICCHHDTRPFADADKRNPRAKFIGANDGGSGVALLCELGKHIADMEGEYGVDFMFFDGEEFVITRPRDRMFLGSTFFAQKYAEGRIPWKYEQAILVDMVGDKDLQIYLEGNSMKFAQGLTQEIWLVAKNLGIKEFIPVQKQFIRDDHLPLNEIAKIPTCDIIDFDFPNPVQGNSFWHTREDKIQNCSAESLGKVGSVVLGWIRQKQKLKPGK